MIRLDTLGTLALRGADGNELRSVLTQPKRLALLCYLAVEAPRGFQRRDQLFGLFWPELTQPQARQALRQALYFLRHSLGDHVVTNRGSDEIGVAPDALRCDVATFGELCAANRHEEALSLYRGDFLPGFFVDGSTPAFEHWLYSTRDELRQRATDAAWSLADAASIRGANGEAAHWARYASRLDSEDEASVRRLISLLDKHGDRAGALRAYAEFAEVLATEFAAEPSAETMWLIDSVRSRTTNSDALKASPDMKPESNTGSASVTAHISQTSTETGAVPITSTAREIRDAVSEQAGSSSAAATQWKPPAWPTRASYRAIFALPLVIAAAAIVIAARYFHTADAPPTLTVGWVQDPSGADTSAMTRTFAELLATDLGRVPGMRVVSRARLYNVLGQLGVRDETPSAIFEAARRAGATQLIEAVLSRNADGTTRLELRRVDLASGATEGSVPLRGANIFELADRATTELAADFHLASPALRVADVTTTSLAAQRLYEEGLRSFYRRDVPAAVRLFHAALSEDSTFAMAAYYAGVGEQQTNGVAAQGDLALALQLSNRVSDRERLIIHQTWAYATNNPVQLAIAESLAARYPEDPDGELALGRALGWDGRFLEALPHLRRVVHMDSLSLNGLSPWCHACDALEATIASYIAADSLDAAERVARAWTRMQPRAQEPWWFLSSMLARQGRYDSALTVEQSAERLSSDNNGDGVTRATIDIAAGRFGDADRLLAEMAQDGNVSRRSDALWWTIISLRNQGRLREALAVAERMVRMTSSEPAGFSTPQALDAVAVGQIQFEMGHFKAAAATFDSITNYDWKSSPGFTSEAPGLLARHHIWMTTQMANALSGAHDTVGLAAALDSVSAWAPRSAFFRDRALGHYMSGLIAQSRGRLADAESEFRQAQVSPIDGYSRVSLELGNTLVAEGRPRAAIAVFTAPLHGSLEASNYYLTQTDLHAHLADAFDRAGERDSALVHYGRVLSAWQHADPSFATRVAAIRQRVNTLQAMRPRIVAHDALRPGSQSVAAAQLSVQRAHRPGE
jgi:serine/threonine-protein kinase